LKVTDAEPSMARMREPSRLTLPSRNGIDFAKDPRLPAETQAGNELFRETVFGLGELVAAPDEARGL
jgi:hypothetical protein